MTEERRYATHAESMAQVNRDWAKGVWQPIETAPRDGTPVKAGKMAQRFGGEWVPYPLTSRFIDGRWCCDMGDRWTPYDPQPTHWQPLLQEPPENPIVRPV